ncbi:uncharacterized protein [Coffea arabica]|uniref:Uncharacterized protein isoform X1 n=2 Tax=Coffea arabica TaxID=13443 RepID=A0ABM4V541_COFAR|nr:transcription factor bHLH110-like isoform X1 [Coffea arabica]
MYPDHSSRDSQVLNKIIMESANFNQHHDQPLQQQEHQQQQQQQLIYPAFSSSTSSSATLVSTVNGQWNPSMVLEGDDFSRYMNEILPNSRDYFWPRSINSVPSVKKSLLEVDHEDSNCRDFRSYLHHPLPSKGGINPGLFLKSDDMNGSILKNSYIKNGQQDVSIDLNENLWIGSFSHSHINQKLSTNESYSNGDGFASFVGLPPSPPNFMSSGTSESTDQHQLYASTSLLPTSQSLPLATEILNCRNFDEGHRTHESFEERMSSDYCHLRQSSDSPSNSSNKTSTFRKEVSRPKTQKPTPSLAMAKKPRVLAPQSSCATLKVRKEKLGDRIAALHRLVSPFGKTDTASVLTEAIGYIQFLQDQIQTLSMAYLKSSRSSKSCRATRGQEVLSMKEDEDEEERAMHDLRSRGLCLVPLAFTSYVCCSYNGSI